MFINLDKNATPNALRNLGLTQWNSTLSQLNLQYETGKIDELTFMEGIQQFIPNAKLIEIREAWNAILQDFPLERLEFLQMLPSQYQLLLLSNTDATHIDKFEHKVGQSFARDFYSCFEKVYFSFDMGLRKPDPKIYQFLLDQHNLIPENTLFVDDKKENTDAAAALGLHVWNLQVGQEDVVDLFDKQIL